MFSWEWKLGNTETYTENLNSYNCTWYHNPIKLHDIFCVSTDPFQLEFGTIEQ